VSDWDPQEPSPEPPEEIAAAHGRGRHPAGFEPTAPARGRSRWIWVAAVVALAGMLAALFGFGLSTDPTLVDSPLIGRRAPDFDLSSLDGTGTLRLSSLRGRVVVLNFWASWCGPCRKEHPDLQATWDRYRSQGVVVVGISYQDTAADGLAFFRELGGDWPLLEDERSRTALAYGVTGVPETFVIDPSGRVAAKFFGPVSYPGLTDEIVTLLRGRER
jgi:cytochrome c biogenesis protein CcmG/thiol:disulfide interchange protein DsbE